MDDALPPVARQDGPTARSAERPAPSDDPFELTPEQRAARRRNRVWLLVLASVSVGILVAALVASGIAESNAPNGPSITAPVGYKVVRDGYFAYAVPASWAQNSEFTDQTGDVDTSGPDGFAAEHIDIRSTPPVPVPGEATPASLQAFGLPQPSPFQLSAGTAISVPGAPSTAYEYRLTRPGRFGATVVNAWNTAYGVEIWLEVSAPPTVTSEILSSLRA